MKAVNKEILKTAANNIFFDMSDSEIETLLDEFKIVQKQMELIGTIKGLDEVEPMTFPFDVTIDYLREDEPGEPLSKNDAIKNAGSTKDGQIKLPKVVI